MDLKKLGKALLFPHLAVRLVLVPIASVFLVYSMVFLETESVLAIISYVLAAYTLTVWCLQVPYFIKRFKRFMAENVYARRWREDDRLRVNVSLFGSLLWNSVYALLQLWLGFYHHTFWFYSIGVYYICLALMRFFLLSHIKKYAPGQQMRSELVKYRACGWIFLTMNLALAVIIFFMLYWNRTFEHHMITAIAMAAYTFLTFTTASLNVVKYRRYNSPVYSASKAISFAAACVSMLTLTSTLLTTFSDDSMDPISQKYMLGGVGTAVSTVVLAMAIYMIVQSTKKIKILNAKENENGKQ